jgi:hypothetical protein
MEHLAFVGFERNSYKTAVGKLKGRDYLGNISVD